jgi:hypothetical protein
MLAYDVLDMFPTIVQSNTTGGGTRMLNIVKATTFMASLFVFLECLWLEIKLIILFLYSTI